MGLWSEYKIESLPQLDDIIRAAGIENQMRRLGLYNDGSFLQETQTGNLSLIKLDHKSIKNGGFWLVSDSDRHPYAYFLGGQIGFGNQIYTEDLLDVLQNAFSPDYKRNALALDPRKM